MSVVCSVVFLSHYFDVLCDTSQHKYKNSQMCFTWNYEFRGKYQEQDINAGLSVT